MIKGVGIVVVVLVLLVLAARVSARSKTSASPAEAVAALRLMALEAPPSKLVAKPVGEEPWAVIMETGYGNAVASIVCLVDGSASLYLSSGGGVIGGGDHEAVGAVAKRLVGTAGRFVKMLAPTSTFPLPADGHTRFYVRVREKVLTAEATEKELGEGNHGLSPLFFAGQEVVTQLRLLSESGK